MSSQADGWSGRNVERARAYVAEHLMPGICHRCGEVVTLEDNWVAGHLEPRWKRPDLMNDPTNLAPEHRRCSDKSARGEQRDAMNHRAELVNQSRTRSPLGKVRGLTPRVSRADPQPSRRTSQVLSQTDHGLPVFDPASLEAVPWLTDLMDSPPEFSWPLVMTPPHSTAVGSYGDVAERWIESELGMTLRWWQRFALRRQYEHDADGELVWSTVVESTPRRSGKSRRMFAVAMHRMADADWFGEPQTVMHTGSDMQICREVWAQGWAYADSHPGWHVLRSNGKETIDAPDGSRWLVRSQDGVYGYPAGLALVDEGWAVKPGTVDDGLEPALMERTKPQLWMTSTANRRATSLMRRRMSTAITEIGDGSATDADTLLLWWGMPPGADLDDPEVWRAASPHWSEQRRRMIARKLERARVGDVDPADDDPDPIQAIVSQYGNAWPNPGKRRAPVGSLVVASAQWASLEVDATPSTPPMVAAVESWYQEGVSVALAWPLDAWRVLVRVSDHPNVPEAARSALSVGADVVLVGKTLATDPAFDGQPHVEAVGSRMTQTATELRQLIDQDVLRHDGGPLLADQVAELRTQRGPEGPRVVSRHRGDAVKAAVWAVARARQPRQVAAVY